MSYLLFNGFRIMYKAACFALCLLFLAGCITATKLNENGAAKGKPPLDQIQLKSVDLRMNKDTADILIAGSGKMQYSAVKQDFPLGVVVYIHNAVLGNNLKIPSSAPDDSGISKISASYIDDSKKGVSIKIFLKDNLNYHVQENGSVVNLTFYKKGETSIFEEKSNQLTNADIFSETDNNISSPVISKADSFEAQNKEQPEQNSYNRNSNNKEIVYSKKRALVTGIDFHSSDDGETSIVVKTSHPVKYDMQRNDLNNQLQLNLYNTNIPEYHQRQLVTTYFNSAVDKIVPVNDHGAEAVSNINITLREKVPYHILQEQNRLTLFLEPSSIKPLKLEENPVPIADAASNTNDNSPLNNSKENKTESLNSPIKLPVKLIDEKSSSSSNQKTSEKENALKTAKPQIISENEQEAIEGDDSDLSEPEDLEAEDTANQQDEIEQGFFDENPVYTGEEISLDFYETDIKNVFRILQTVSGENFAIDKDVKGNVTLTLEKPAPWDEILDLILKMNGLGKIKEGSIVRIATMGTIKREEDEKAALFASKLQAMEQRKQQEPMFTEYIPINYSSAASDIKPHIDKILTPPRSNAGGIQVSGGTMTVDSRTNMIILTDTKNKIALAKEIIYKLDKVTPQIMISARIVEVTKDFSRELGVDWGLSSQDVYRDDLGGLYGFDIAMNHPVSSSSGIGYTFNRLAGTPLLLDAKLTASELTGDTKIISSPKILTLDNKVAKIDQGLEYGYQSGVDENGNPVIAFKPIKLSLEVTPGVTPDKRVKMKLKISKNEVSGTVAGIPSLSTSEANTELLVNDGNTIVIGGIVKSTVSEGRTGFPLLSSIPYVGQLFRSDTSKDMKNELLIFITPTIVQLDQKANKL